MYIQHTFQQHGVRTPLYSGGVFVSTSILQVITWRLHMVPIEFIIIFIKYLTIENESNSKYSQYIDHLYVEMKLFMVSIYIRLLCAY
jgi:hypothetical protein